MIPVPGTLRAMIRRSALQKRGHEIFQNSHQKSEFVTLQTEEELDEDVDDDAQKRTYYNRRAVDLFLNQIMHVIYLQMEKSIYNLFAKLGGVWR